MNSKRIFIIFGILACIVLDGALWIRIASSSNTLVPSITFLDVGQGDASLIFIPPDIHILIDAGPDDRVLRAIERALPPDNRTIDLAIITHAQLDHFGGFRSLLDRYHIGTFLMSGHPGEPDKEMWTDLLARIHKASVPIVRTGAGDRVRISDSSLSILAPSLEELGRGEVNDTGIVARLDTPFFRALFTADIGSGHEQSLLAHPEQLAADILKVGHHGSAYSSSDAFLSAVGARIATIGVGTKNSYGHPSPNTLARLAAHGLSVFRTDQNGIIRIVPNGKVLKVIGIK